MNEKISINWDGGTIDIWLLGCKMVPKFQLKNKIVEPMHSANWIGEKNSEDLPGILKNLSGEFPCVPFGINTPIEQLSDEWKETYSEKPYVINEPHGFSANNTWEVIEHTENKASFKIKYPEEDLIEYLIRTIEVNNSEPSIVKCKLIVKVKTDCSLPIGLHPMIKVPSEKNKLKILPGKFDFGLTYPGILLKGKTLGAINKKFTSIENVPSITGEEIDISTPPFDGNYEDLFQLCGIDGSMQILNYLDNYSFKMIWNPQHFTSVLMWLSNKGREEYPWNSNHVTFGLEPITSTFGLSTDLSLNSKNPINSKGVKTSLDFKKNIEWETNYSFTLEEI